MDERLVNLAIFERNSEALALASKLRAYKIFAHVYGPTAALPQWRSIQIGGIPVKVRAADYEIAKALMEDASEAPRRPTGRFARHAPALGVTLSAAVMAALIVRACYGLTNEAFFGLSLILPLVYLVALGEAIRTRRQWWTLATLPIAALFPIALWSA